MREMHLRGYVSPDDFEGTPTQRLQKAMDVSAQEDIARVVITGEWLLDKTVYIHPMTDVVLENAVLRAAGDFPLLGNAVLGDTEKDVWAFENRYVRLTGNGAKLYGDVTFHHAGGVVVEDVEFFGTLYFSFTREVRMARCRFEAKHAVVLAQGCNNFIMQGLTGSCTAEAVVMDAGKLLLERYVIGKDSEIHEIILQDSDFTVPEAAIAMLADETSGIFNIQIDHIKSSAGVLSVGTADKQVPAERFFNLTAVEVQAGSKDAVVLKNPAKHYHFA